MLVGPLVVISADRLGRQLNATDLSLCHDVLQVNRLLMIAPRR